jgi:hypothetical protein
VNDKYGPPFITRNCCPARLKSTTITLLPFGPGLASPYIAAHGLDLGIVKNRNVKVCCPFCLCPSNHKKGTIFCVTILLIESLGHVA